VRDPVRIQQQDHLQCFYCKKILSRSQLEREHVVPIARGGLDEPFNIVLACRGCNGSKGSRLPSEWRSDLPADVLEFEKVSVARHSRVDKRVRNVLTRRPPWFDVTGVWVCDQCGDDLADRRNLAYRHPNKDYQPSILVGINPWLEGGPLVVAVRLACGMGGAIEWPFGENASFRQSDIAHAKALLRKAARYPAAADVRHNMPRILDLIASADGWFSK